MSLRGMQRYQIRAESNGCAHNGTVIGSISERSSVWCRFVLKVRVQEGIFPVYLMMLFRAV